MKLSIGVLAISTLAGLSSAQIGQGINSIVSEATSAGGVVTSFGGGAASTVTSGGGGLASTITSRGSEIASTVTSGGAGVATTVTSGAGGVATTVTSGAGNAGSSVSSSVVPSSTGSQDGALSLQSLHGSGNRFTSLFMGIAGAAGLGAVLL